MREKLKIFGLLFACSFVYFFAYSFFGFDFTDMGYHLTCAQRVYAGDALAQAYYGSNWIAGLWLSLCPIEGKVIWCYWGGAILWGLTTGFIGLLIHEIVPLSKFAVVAVTLAAVASFPLSQADLIIQYYSLPMLLVVAYLNLFLSAAKAGGGMWRWALLSCLYVVMVWTRITTLVYAVCPLLYLGWNCLFVRDKKRAFVQAAVWTAVTVVGSALLGFWYSHMTFLENPNLDTNRWAALGQSMHRIVSSLGLMLRALGAGLILIFLLERSKFIYGKRVAVIALAGVAFSLLTVGFVNEYAATALAHMPRVLACAVKGIQAYVYDLLVILIMLAIYLLGVCKVLFSRRSIGLVTSCVIAAAVACFWLAAYRGSHSEALYWMIWKYTRSIYLVIPFLVYVSITIYCIRFPSNTVLRASSLGLHGMCLLMAALYVIAYFGCLGSAAGIFKGYYAVPLALAIGGAFYLANESQVLRTVARYGLIFFAVNGLCISLIYSYREAPKLELDKRICTGALKGIYTTEARRQVVDEFCQRVSPLLGDSPAPVFCEGNRRYLFHFLLGTKPQCDWISFAFMPRILEAHPPGFMIFPLFKVENSDEMDKEQVVWLHSQFLPKFYDNIYRTSNYDVYRLKESFRRSPNES